VARPTYHWLRLRAVAHPTEDAARVEEALRFVSGLEPEAFRAALSTTRMDSHHGLPLIVMEAVLERSRALRDVLGRILALPGATQRLSDTLESRVDDDGILYLRVEKQAAAQGLLVLTEGEDALQVRLKVEAYPANRAAALAALQAMLEHGA
jgi:RNA-binding protein